MVTRRYITFNYILRYIEYTTHSILQDDEYPLMEASVLEKEKHGMVMPDLDEHPTHYTPTEDYCPCCFPFPAIVNVIAIAIAAVATTTSDCS